MTGDASGRAEPSVRGEERGPNFELYDRSPFEEERTSTAVDEDRFERHEPSVYEPIWVPIATPRVRNRIWLHALLFAVTILTTTAAGVDHWLSFHLGFTAGPIPPFSMALMAKGLWYSATILLILGAHELGHYFACRYYGIDASLPYFLPVPIPMTGTLGAFIRIRQPVRTKRQIFDVGIAGPLAGFALAVPALFIGMALSTLVPAPAADQFRGQMMELGEPLLFKLASMLVWGPVAGGLTLNMHPMVFAAWFGLLATALNLFPIGQLDGGHISYAVLKSRSTTLTFAALGALLVLNVVLAVVYQTIALVFFTLLIVVMLAVFGPRHPPVMDEHQPLGRARLVLALVALVVFVLSFTPVPIRVL